MFSLLNPVIDKFTSWGPTLFHVGMPSLLVLSGYPTSAAMAFAAEAIEISYLKQKGLTLGEIPSVPFSLFRCWLRGKKPSLHAAARLGDVGLLKTLLDTTHQIDGKDNTGKTPLHHATEAKQIDVVNFLLDKGAARNIADKQGRCPIHTAARLGDVGLLKVLLKDKHKINEQDSEGKTPLHHAVEAKQIDAVNFLPDEGGVGPLKILLNTTHQIDEKDNEGKTPLHHAIEAKQIDAVNFLLDEGAAHDIADKRGRCPIHVAASKGLNEAIDALGKLRGQIRTEIGDLAIVVERLELGSWCMKDKKGRTPFHYAAIYGQLETLKHLKKRLTSMALSDRIYNSDYSDRTALHYAAKQGHLEVLEWLIIQENFACYERHDDYGLTPLHYAAMRENYRAMDLLLKSSIKDSCVVNEQRISFWPSPIPRGPKTNALRYGETLLHFAARHGNLSMADWLIQRGAFVNGVNLNSRSPLYLAIQHRNFEVAELLVKAADVEINKKDEAGETPLIWTVAKLHPKSQDDKTLRNEVKFLSTLLQHGADWSIENRLRIPLLPLINSCLSPEERKLIENAITEGLREKEPISRDLKALKIAILSDSSIPNDRYFATTPFIEKSLYQKYVLENKDLIRKNFLELVFDGEGDLKLVLREPGPLEKLILHIQAEDAKGTNNPT